MSTWSVSLDALVEKAKGDVDLVVRRSTFELFQKVIQRSPVGNPDNWKANSGQAYKRQTYNLFADALNAAIQADPASYTKGGRLKAKLAKPKSEKALRKTFPNVAGKGYVGGRFRANWNVSLGVADESTTESTDLSRSLGQAQKAMTFKVGGVVLLCNALPYARRLEYGWSKQAPQGMVRLAVQEFNDFVQKAVAAK